MTRRPFIAVLAGVNGAGKSAVGGSLLQDVGLPCYNPDTFAREMKDEAGLSLAEANARAWQYGFDRLRQAIDQHGNFALETTLGGSSISQLLLEAAKTHDVLVWFCGLTSPELHIERVTLRVAHGGHPIPPETIRERWRSSRSNLITLLPHLTRLQLFDNSFTVADGDLIPSPPLVLDYHNRRVLVPDACDHAALVAIPEWAKPIVEKALLMVDTRHSPTPHTTHRQIG